MACLEKDYWSYVKDEKEMHKKQTKQQCFTRKSTLVDFPEIASKIACAPPFQTDITAQKRGTRGVQNRLMVDFTVENRLSSLLGKLRALQKKSTRETHTTEGTCLNCFELS